eukprot:gene1066-biopygen1075
MSFAACAAVSMRAFSDRTWSENQRVRTKSMTRMPSLKTNDCSARQPRGHGGSSQTYCRSYSATRSSVLGRIGRSKRPNRKDSSAQTSTIQKTTKDTTMTASPRALETSSKSRTMTNTGHHRSSPAAAVPRSAAATAKQPANVVKTIISYGIRRSQKIAASDSTEPHTPTTLPAMNSWLLCCHRATTPISSRHRLW